MSANTQSNSTHISDLLNGGWRSLDFSPFREGIEICLLHEEFPQVALLRYEAGASAPMHRHTGLETIIVLDGEQSDEFGSYPQGSVVMNEKGSEHSVWSSSGCVVLIQWQSAVEFI